MKFLQKRIHFLVPDAGTAWVCRLTILLAFHFGCFGSRPRQPIPYFTCKFVSLVIPFDHTVAVTSHMDVVKARLPIIKKFDGMFINFSKGLLLLHSYILAHAESNG